MTLLVARRISSVVLPMNNQAIKPALEQADAMIPW